MATKKSKSLDFSASYKELEDIIAWFEREDVDLDEGLRKFERGLVLAEACKVKLSEVEHTVKDIKARFASLDSDVSE